MSSFALKIIAGTCAVVVSAVVGVATPTWAPVAIVPVTGVTTGRSAPLLALGSCPSVFTAHRVSLISILSFKDLLEPFNALLAVLR